jgi:AcrR family transcriptional regulator
MALSGAKTRVRILDAAYVLFRKKGFARVNVDEIADASGATKRTLYARFTSKDELLAAVLEAQHRLAFDAFQTFDHELSGTDPARSIARRHAAELEAHVAQLLSSAGIARAKQGTRQLCILFDGAMILALIHGDRACIGAAARAAETLMETSAKRAVARR